MQPTTEQIAAAQALPFEQRRTLGWYNDYLRAEIERSRAEDPMARAAAEYLAERQSAEDRWWASELAGMTDEAIAYRIAQIDEEADFLPYRALTVNIADRGAGLADERRRLVAEQAARSVSPELKMGEVA